MANGSDLPVCWGSLSSFWINQEVLTKAALITKTAAELDKDLASLLHITFITKFLYSTIDVKKL